MHTYFFGNWLKAYIVFAIVTGLFGSCEQEPFQSGRSGDFTFSADTVMFDTIFTSLGTTTHKLLIKNPGNSNLEIDSIYLSNQGRNGFIVNINGITQLPARKIIIDPKDSLFVFIQAYIPASENGNPFLNEDSLMVTSGRITKNVKLIAFGQNIVNFRDENIKSQEWFDTKPYLIFGTLTVDSGSHLKIHEGVRVYFHRNSRLVVNGSIEVSGSQSFPVHFRGSRLDKDYDTIPGQWSGIFLTGTSRDNIINYAKIRNATVGIQIGVASSQKQVKAKISNTIIANQGYSAITSYQADLEVTNSVFVNSGNTVCFLAGGSYSFIHCTLGNYGAAYISRAYNSKTLILQNFSEYKSPVGKIETTGQSLTKAYFGNTIIYGTNPEEIWLNKKNEFAFNYLFENCILRTPARLDSDFGFKNCQFNKSPKFIRPASENFRLDTLSPAKDAGKEALGLELPFDIENNMRTEDAAPDPGAYERKEKP